MTMNGVQPMHTNDILQENMNPIIIPVKIEQIASKIDPNPSVETPLII